VCGEGGDGRRLEVGEKKKGVAWWRREQRD